MARGLGFRRDGVEVAHGNAADSAPFRRSGAGRGCAYVEAQEWIHRNVRLQDAVAALKSIFKEDEDALRKTMEDAEYQLKQDWKEMKKCVEEGRLLPPVFEPTPFVEMPKASMESE